MRHQDEGGQPLLRAMKPVHDEHGKRTGFEVDWEMRYFRTYVGDEHGQGFSHLSFGIFDAEGNPTSVADMGPDWTLRLADFTRDNLFFKVEEDGVITGTGT